MERRRRYPGAVIGRIERVVNIHTTLKDTMRAFAEWHPHLGQLSSQHYSHRAQVRVQRAAAWTTGSLDRTQMPS